MVVKGGHIGDRTKRVLQHQAPCGSLGSQLDRTAPPSDSPISTISLSGIIALSASHVRAARPSAMIPASLGEPELRP